MNRNSNSEESWTEIQLDVIFTVIQRSWLSDGCELDVVIIIPEECQCQGISGEGKAYRQQSLGSVFSHLHVAQCARLPDHGPIILSTFTA